MTIADGDEIASHLPTQLASSGSMDLIENEFQFLKDYDSSGFYRGSYIGYIDVGDGCWRPNELVTSLRC